MAEVKDFENFDEGGVYTRSRARALNESTRNFVVEFGKDKAHIAFDLDVTDVEALLEAETKPETPVRWM